MRSYHRSRLEPVEGRESVRCGDLSCPFSREWISAAVARREALNHVRATGHPVTRRQERVQTYWAREVPD